MAERGSESNVPSGNPFSDADIRWLHTRLVEELRKRFEREGKTFQHGEDTEGSEAMTDQERAELEAKVRKELEAEFAQRQQVEAELAERIRKELQPQIEAELTQRVRKQAELAEFVGSVTSGDTALSTPPAELTAFLAGLTPEQLEKAKAILQAKVVDLSERGHTGAGQKKESLPPEMLAALKRFVLGRTDITKAVATFCEANQVKQEEYDLSEFLPRA